MKELLLTGQPLKLHYNGHAFGLSAQQRLTDTTNSHNGKIGDAPVVGSEPTRPRMKHQIFQSEHRPVSTPGRGNMRCEHRNQISTVNTKGQAPRTCGPQTHGYQGGRTRWCQIPGAFKLTATERATAGLPTRDDSLSSRRRESNPYELPRRGSRNLVKFT